MPRASPSLREQVRPKATEVVLALVVGAAERARICGALRGRYAVQCVERIAELRTLTTDRRAIYGVVVEARDVDGVSTAEAICLIHTMRPDIPVVGYCRAGIAHSNDVRSLALAGVHELLFHGIDDTGTALRDVLAMARQASVGEIVASALTPMVPERLWPFVRHVTAHPAESQRVAEVARALGHHRKTLVNHCAQAGLPSPQELLAWCRLAVIGHLLGISDCTIEAISLQLDFPSDTALRNLVKRYVGMKASEVRAGGGLPVVVAAFERAVIASRVARHASG